jgi:hypothetical protein
MERKQRKSVKLVSGVLILALLGGAVMGCETLRPKTSALEQDYGNSVANNKARMIINTRAHLQVEATTGLPPKAASNSMESYDKSFLYTDRKGTTLKLTTDK